MRRVSVSACLMLVLTVGLGGCATTQRREASALSYLYPEGHIESSADAVALQLPLRVGVAFAPGDRSWDAFSEPQRREILKRVAAAFEGVPEIQFVEVLPTNTLTRRGGFENLRQAAGMYGMNLVAILSYNQIQFVGQRRSSFLYWTLIGAYFVRGEHLETHTLLDANVFDLASRAMLFSGSGSSIVRERSTPVEADLSLRETSIRGFEQATDDLVRNLSRALEVFRENAKRGTVRGLGTPRVQVQSPAVVAASRSGAGAWGPLELMGVLALVAAAGWSTRRSAP